MRIRKTLVLVTTILLLTRCNLLTPSVFFSESDLYPEIYQNIFLLVLAGGIIFLTSWIWTFIFQKTITSKTQSIHQSEQKYRNLIENSYDAFFVLHKKRFVIANRNFEKMFGYSHQELLRSDFSPARLIHPDDLIAFRRIIAQLSEKKSERYEINALTKDHQKLPVEISINSMNSNSELMIQGSVRDMSLSKKKEAFLQKAREKAEDNDRLKSTFIANISHEIRTPLNGIMGFARLLTRAELTNQEKMSYFSYINQSCMRMLSTLNDILEVSRIEAGKTEIEYTELTIKSFLEKILARKSVMAMEKKLILEFLPEANFRLDRIWADKQKLETVICILLDNAVKFTRSGKVQLGYQKPSSNQIRITVSDTGIGIPSDQLDSIYKSFEQIEDSVVKTKQGSGLGLAIAKSYMEAMNGTIGVESCEGVGTVFTLQMPIEPGVNPS